MARPSDALLIVGSGASGRTHRLEEWVAGIERSVDGPVVRLSGSVHRWNGAAPGSEGVDTTDARSIERVRGAGAVAVDDAHWLTSGLLDAIAEATQDLPVGVARARWPTSPSLDALGSELTRRRPPLELGPHAIGEIETLAPDGSVDAARLHRWSGGLIGWWWPATQQLDDRSPDDVDDTALPIGIVDVVLRRARAAGPDVVQVAQAMSLGVDMSAALVALTGASVDDRLRTDDLERRLRESGLVEDGELIPLVRAGLAGDLTVADRAALSERFLHGSGGARLRHDTRARLVVVADPTTSIEPAERIRALLRLGDPEAARLVDSLPAGAASRSVLDELDLADLRFDEVARREPFDSIARFAAAAAGMPSSRPSPTDADASSPYPSAEPTADDGLIDGLTEIIVAATEGRDDHALELGARLCDDALRGDPDPGIGWSPAAVVGAVWIGLGEPEAALGVLRTALEHQAGGPGHQRCLRSLAAFAGISCGEYAAALDLVREPAGDTWLVRDRFLHAAVDAAIARRSGDTTRLREAWARCEQLLVQRTVSWLLYDATVEILAAGARVSDHHRPRTLTTTLRDRLGRLGGAATHAAHWLDLQTAISREDWDTVRLAGESLATMTSTTTAGRRARARAAAGGVWSAIAVTRDGASGFVDLAALDTAVDELVSVGDAWEASRLLGQVALDHDDTVVARGLLERARLLVTEPTDAADGLIAAGLSEREADVARLVAEGRTYKEIGAQLYISAKTVEHHVARLRQRLGASSRAELLAIVRELA